MMDDDYTTPEISVGWTLNGGDLCPKPENSSPNDDNK
jgi:hypothetical protein